MALEDLSGNMKAARKAHGYTQEGLARKADLSLNVVAKIELGLVRNPHIETVAAIADALDLSVDELVGGSVGKAPAPATGTPPEEDEGLIMPGAMWHSHTDTIEEFSRWIVDNFGMLTEAAATELDNRFYDTDAGLDYTGAELRERTHDFLMDLRAVIAGYREDAREILGERDHDQNTR
jgi:transcriptional regulator with XRE-family HTH domain